MKIYIILLITPFILSSTELKIANYNVENLFDDVKNGDEYKEYIPNTHNWTKEILNKKLSHITRVICDLNPDIIGLEEIENSRALKLLQKSLSKAGCKYRFSAITHKRGSAIQIALLSRIKIDKKRDLKVSNSSADRNILEVDLKTEPKLKIFVNHWRSKKSAESARVKYAKVLIDRIKKLPKESEYIIIGDFNSNYDECSNLSKKNNDTNGVCGIDTILHTFQYGRLLKLKQKIGKESIYHYNLWSELSTDKRWSYNFFGKKSAIDSIIIPVSLNDNSGWFYEKGSFRVFKKKYLFKKSMLNRWDYYHGKHSGRGYSDHLPIYALFSNTKTKELKHETILDKFWKLFIPNRNKSKNINSNKSLRELTIDELIQTAFFKHAVILKRGCVIFKRGNTAVIKSSKNSKTITLYRSADGLQEGKCYKLKVYKKKKYFGLNEITDLDIVQENENINTQEYIPDFNSSLMDENIKNIGEIVKNIKGTYNRYVKIGHKRYKLFLKVKNRGLLKKNSKLYIKKAQIGYYKGKKELVVYSLDDISQK